MFRTLNTYQNLTSKYINPLKQEMDLFTNSNQLSFHNKQFANRKEAGGIGREVTSPICLGQEKELQLPSLSFRHSESSQQE